MIYEEFINYSSIKSINFLRVSFLFTLLPPSYWLRPFFQWQSLWILNSTSLSLCTRGLIHPFPCSSRRLRINGNQVCRTSRQCPPHSFSWTLFGFSAESRCHFWLPLLSLRCSNRLSKGGSHPYPYATCASFTRPCRRGELLTLFRFKLTITRFLRRGSYL